MVNGSTNCGELWTHYGVKPYPLKDKIKACKPASYLLNPAKLNLFGFDGVQ